MSGMGDNSTRAAGRLMVSASTFKQIGVSAADASAAMAKAAKTLGSTADSASRMIASAASGMKVEVNGHVPDGEMWVLDENSIADGVGKAWTSGTFRMPDGNFVTIGQGDSLQVTESFTLDGSPPSHDENVEQIWAAFDPGVESVDTTLSERIIEEARVATGGKTHPPEDLLAEMREKAASLGIELRLQRKLVGLRMDWQIIAHTKRGEVTSVVVPPVGAPASWDAQDIADAWRDAFAKLGLL